MTARLEFRTGALPHVSPWVVALGERTLLAAEAEVRRRRGIPGLRHFAYRVGFDDPIAQACYDAVNPDNCFDEAQP